MKRSRIRSQSKKKAKENREYTKLNRIFLAENPRCQCRPDSHSRCIAPATETHHRKGRGAYLLQTDTWMAVCQSCHHDKIHGNPGWARDMGYMINRASSHPIEPIE